MFPSAESVAPAFRYAFRLPLCVFQGEKNVNLESGPSPEKHVEILVCGNSSWRIEIRFGGRKKTGIALVFCDYLDWRGDFALPLSLRIHSTAPVNRQTLPRIDSKLKVRGNTVPLGHADLPRHRRRCGKILCVVQVILGWPARRSTHNAKCLFSVHFFFSGMTLIRRTSRLVGWAAALALASASPRKVRGGWLLLMKTPGPGNPNTALPSPSCLTTKAHSVWVLLRVTPLHTRQTRCSVLILSPSVVFEQSHSRSVFSETISPFHRKAVTQPR